ncbi:MAG: hypothetical protein PUG83_07895 [Clostridiaceae bacterium]|nr:hypothetical protein [Clostridiaceae bacterium]
MSEYIEREALMRNLKHFAPEQLTPLIKSLIQKQPAEDVVEVVRCKDCKNYDNQFSVDNCGWCDEFNCGTSDEKFCSYGKREVGESG